MALSEASAMSRDAWAVRCSLRVFLAAGVMSIGNSSCAEGLALIIRKSRSSPLKSTATSVGLS